MPSVPPEFEFGTLQEKLVVQWPVLGSPSDEEKTMVVVPSLSVDVPIDLAPMLPAYEERFLFLLLLLRQPRARVVYITSMPVHPRIVDYYLGLVPGLDSPATRQRLHMLTITDPSAVPLSQKILDRPGTIARIRDLITDIDRAHLVPFNTTELEKRLTVALGIPMFAASPAVAVLGSKSGSRTIFSDEGIPHPRGVEHVHSIDGIEAGIRQLVEADPSVDEFVVKLNHGVGGYGNGHIVLSDRPLKDSVLAVELEGRDQDRQRFFASLAEEGGIVEERLRGAEIRSPSVQMRATPTGEVELLSTHDQVLGGSTGQRFMGARFPADPAYAPAICEQATKVGRRLALEGVLGRFAVDFVVVSDGEGAGWRTYAIEINLRKGGTTHPFLTLQFLTDGAYDPEATRFTTALGAERHYVATDHLDHESFRRLTPDDIIDLATHEDIRWDPEKEVGVVWHMISAIATAGRVGMTAIAASAEEADRLFARAAHLLEARVTEDGKLPLTGQVTNGSVV